MPENAPKDELIPPEWMDKNFFKKVLIDTEKDVSIEVTKFIIKPGSGEGDHYASVMFRAIITFNNAKSKDLEKVLILKTMPFVDGPKKDFLINSGIFDVEVKMYKEVIPLFEKVLREAKDNTVFGCKCIYSEMEPHKIMIFEDLTQKNYKVPKTNNNNNIEIVKKALVKLAKWHAISYKEILEGNKVFEQFTTATLCNESLKNLPVFLEGFPFFVEMLKKHEEFNEYVPKFEKLLLENPNKKAEKILSSFFEGNHANFFVLNHGDFHLGNFMVSENEDDVAILDYQVCFVGPAVIDLNNMIYTMLDNETRTKGKEEIIYFYFSHFLETLEKINFKGDLPKLTDLYKDFLTFKDFELFLITTYLPFLVKMEKSEIKEDIDEIQHGDNYRKNLYNNPNFIEAVRELLPKLLHKGFLE